jgi:hypothetical protein
LRVDMTGSSLLINTPYYFFLLDTLLLKYHPLFLPS